jgi:hypothetical protein
VRLYSYRNIHDFLALLQNKQELMISNFTIFTVPQWAIFAAVTVVIYGWVEQKRAFGLVGSGILIALSLFAGWAVYTGMLLPEGLFGTAEALGGEELFMPDELPVEGRMLPFYWGLILNGVVALGAFIAEATNRKPAKPLKILMSFIAMLLFFGMVGVARM